MCQTKQVSQWRSEVQEVLESKVSEFQLLDYQKTTTDDIWACLIDKVWKGDPEKKLYEVVQDVFHLHPSLYMTYLTQQSWQDTNLQASIDALFGDDES
ncbi:hypothetical protein J416_07392 [Gracilibacillus halophilus YIM-C55.5]|uniref:Post-transcriptional regulator n=1 Tax=Gracilibacillus halophilus YIM-C55.5 TaxID=1308866 RepID=N4WCZ7_9BACI|nr:post-transcriptional regulator [Gracilibacillus halophilus]ENH97094.1 hypothetical protein J416_07392 [Gracilibacillus halophilus YIM-C55.5]